MAEKGVEEQVLAMERLHYYNAVPQEIHFRHKLYLKNLCSNIPS